MAPPWQSSSIHILVWYSLVWYCMIWFGLVGYGNSMAVVQHSSSAECYQSWYCMVQHCIFWFGMVLYGVVWYSLLSVMAIRREKHRHMGLQSNVCCRQSSTEAYGPPSTPVSFTKFKSIALINLLAGKLCDMSNFVSVYMYFVCICI